MLYKILIYLFLFQNGNNFVYIIFSRCRKKVKHQEVTIRTRQKPKEETRKTRVTSCPRSHQEEEEKNNNNKKKDGRSASWKSVWIINCMFMPWKTTVKVLETWQLQNWGIIVTRHDAAYSYTRTGDVMNNSFITTQITHLKTTNPNGPSTMYPQSTYHFSSAHFFISEFSKPFSFHQYSNSLLSQSFPAESNFASYDPFRGIQVKVKVKFTLEQASKARRGSRGIALLFL